jgi:AcrR family transcriptional regulator
MATTTEIEAELGLRERKRLATSRAIQRAVVELSLERGFDRVTVDDISAEAQVSPRTFFNYFPSKEAAVVGEVPTLPNDDLIDRFVTAADGGSVLDGIRDLLIPAADADTAAADHDIHRMRRELLKDNPQLFSLRMASMKQLEADLTGVVARRIAHDDPVLAEDDDALRSRARLITFVAFAGIRHAWSSWADHGGAGPLSARLRESFAELQSLSQGSLKPVEL